MIRSSVVAVCTAVFLQAANSPSMLTPGQVALLVNRTDTEYRQLLRQAIADPDPIVRLLAARVAAVRRQADMAEPLKDALAREVDGSIAAVEQRRALQILGHESPAATPSPAVGQPPITRVMPTIAPGLLKSLIAAAKCRTRNDDDYGALYLTFDADGAVQRSLVDRGELSDGCSQVLSALARLAIRQDVAGENAPQAYLLVPLNADGVVCNATWQEFPAKLWASKTELTVPRLKREVKPLYPDSERQRGGMQGVVELEVVVAPSGCVGSARVRGSLDPAFDLEALRAAMRWRFEPGRMSGVPVPVRVNLELTFKLK
jgi:TonB family protein